MYTRKFFTSCLLTLIPFVIGWVITTFPAILELYTNYRLMVDFVVIIIWLGIGWHFAMTFKDTSLGLIVGNFAWGIGFFSFMAVNLYGLNFLSFLDDFSLNYVYNFTGIGGSIASMFNIGISQYFYVFAYVFMFIVFILGFSAQRLLLKAIRGKKK